ncbi:MAG: hypothetical protein GOVbin3250_33 [Prokaryotic dsDNA virus sp.]|nr:MAG: hypothetical protein GOVbin3250_33 [Prokaryotic dsDNA virus sp.]
MVASGLLYAVDQTSEPHTEESAGFVLPTPTCHDIKNNMSPSCWNRDADLGVEIAKMEGYTQDSIIGKGLRIHPHFITWMMGFPIDWLD